MPANKDTIAAIATPPGRSGIGVIRVSGKLSSKIYQALTGRQPKNRYAHHVSFKSSSNQTIDKGISLYFKGPASYTGEDVMECYAHGNRTETNSDDGTVSSPEGRLAGGCFVVVSPGRLL